MKKMQYFGEKVAPSKSEHTPPTSQSPPRYQAITPLSTLVPSTGFPQEVFHLILPPLPSE